MINHDVFAKALLQRASGSGLAMCNLKLQKLAYYCQGYHLAVHGSPLFNAPICAWTHGPVITSLYHEYKVHGDGNITVPSGLDYVSQLSESALEIVDFVIMKFGQVGAWILRNKTHQESPWLSHYDAVIQSADKQEITHQELIGFFKMEVAKMQDTTFAKILDAVDDDYIIVPKTITNKKEFNDWILGA